MRVDAFNLLHVHQSSSTFIQKMCFGRHGAHVDPGSAADACLACFTMMIIVSARFSSFSPATLNKTSMYTVAVSGLIH